MTCWLPVSGPILTAGPLPLDFSPQSLRNIRLKSRLPFSDVYIKTMSPGFCRDLFVPWFYDNGPMGVKRHLDVIVGE